MTAVELLTLAPLGAMVVAFGLFPGILLDLFVHPVETALADTAAGTAIPVDPLFVVVGIGILVAIVGARFFSIMGRGPDADTSTQPAEGAA